MSDLHEATENVAELIRQRDHAVTQVERLKQRIRDLEYANAELVVRDKQLTERLKEASGRRPPRNHHSGGYRKRA